jgi:ubiquinone/menaquinone biosynthesis C-methylase UbiE
MALAKFLAGQLRRPSGITGGIILPRLFNKRNSALNDLTLECLALQPQDRALDVGCGGGYLLRRMSDIITDGLVAGVDWSPQMVAFCERRYRSLIEDAQLEVRCASAEALPYPPGFFTKACTVNTIFYLPDASLAVSELRRVLADGGTLVICFTAKESLKNRGFVRHGLSLFETGEVRQLMESSGFQEIRMIRGSDRHREFTCAVGRK